MDVLKRNLLANLTGTVWFGVLSLALVSFYVRFLGMEAFGLIAFQGTLATMVHLLDAGLSVATNRELARLSTDGRAAPEARTVTRSAEVTCWAIAMTAGAVLLVLTPLIAQHWLEVRGVPAAVTTQAVALAIVATILQFPYTFYAAGLLGLQHHVAVNVILVGASTIRAAGAVILIVTFRADIRALFLWFIACALLQTAAAGMTLHRALPPGPARFDGAVLRRVFRFARGVGASGTIGVAATQVDKLAISNMLPLSVFGFYSIGGMIATAVALTVTPVQTTVFPRLSQIVARGDGDGEAALYHRATQTVAAILLPVSAMTTIFAYDVVLLWTQSTEIAGAVRWIAVLLVAGTTLNALSHISHALQLAHGWTAPAVIANAVQLVLMIPLTLFAIRRYGAVGAAAVFALLQLSFLLISLTVTHTRTLRGHARSWLFRDVAPAFCASFGVAAVCRWFTGDSHGWMLGVTLGAISAAVLVAGALSTQVVREWLRERWLSRAARA
jgi:O-antigen/teichoic acid export membrane protein